MADFSQDELLFVEDLIRETPSISDDDIFNEVDLLREELEAEQFEEAPAALEEGIEGPKLPTEEERIEFGVSEEIPKTREQLEPEPKPVLSKGEELKQEAISFAEQAEQAEGVEKAKLNAKGVLKTLQAATQILPEQLIEKFGDVISEIGIMTSGVSLTDEQKEETRRGIELEKETPEAKQKLSEKGEIIKSAALIGTPVPIAGALPKATTLAGKVFKGAAIGAEAGAEFKILSEGEIPSLRETGINSAFGAALERTASLIKASGSKLFKSAFAATQKEADLLQDFMVGRVKREPRTRAVTALEKGLVGSEKRIGVLAGQEADKLKGVVTKALEDTKKVITKDELLLPVIDEISKITDGTRRKQLMKAVEAFIEANADLPNDISLTDAQELKRQLAKFLPQKAFRGEEISGALNEIRNKLARNIRTLTYNKLKDQGIKNKYLDWGNLLQLEDLSKNVLKQKGFQGGSGGLVNALVNTVTTPIQTIGGRTLYQVGNQIIEGKSGAEKLSQIFQQQGIEEDDLEDFAKVMTGE